MALGKARLNNVSTPNLLQEEEKTLQKNDIGHKSASAMLTPIMEKVGPWMFVIKDPVAGLKAYTQHLLFSNVKGDSENRFIVSDLSNKLAVYKGNTIESVVPLVSTPIAITSFIGETGKNQMPYIAVACESAIYIFKNLKPYFRLILPQEEIISEEIELWNSYDGDNLQDLMKGLNELRVQERKLTSSANQILSMDTREAQIEIAEYLKGTTKTAPDAPTCISIIPKSDEEGSVSHLVFGTEKKNLYIMDPSGTNFHKKIYLDAVPFKIRIIGTMDQGFKIYIATTDSKILIINNSVLESKHLAVDLKIVDFTLLGTDLYVALMDNNIDIYSNKHLKSFSIKLPASIICIDSFEFGKTKIVKGLFVALANKQLRIYNEKQLVHSLDCQDEIMGFRFGRLGREEGSLVTVYKNGGFDVKVLPRQFTFQGFLSKSTDNVQREDEIPLGIPKKTKIFLEDAQRERDSCKEIHQGFQKDKILMKLKTSKTYLNTISNGSSKVSGSSSSIRADYDVEGLGPLFCIKLQLQNVGKTLLKNISMRVFYDDSIFKLMEGTYEANLIIPKVKLPLKFNIKNIDANGSSDYIRIGFFEKDKSQSLLFIDIKMPMSELEFD